MQNRWIMLMLVVVGLLVGACSQGEELPTAVAFPTDVTPMEMSDATATLAPLERSTLPPTWTNTPVETDTLSQPQEDIVASPIYTPPPMIETVSSCDTFQADADRSTREFIIGDTPVAAWTPVQGVVLYRIFLYDFDGKTIRDDIYTDQTRWEFDPNAFELGSNYIWAVWPLGAKGEQMCFERGLELLPIRRPINR